MTGWINIGSHKASATDAAGGEARRVREDEYRVTLRRHKKMTLVMYAIAIVLGGVTAVSGILLVVDLASGESWAGEGVLVRRETYRQHGVDETSELRLERQP